MNRFAHFTIAFLFMIVTGAASCELNITEDNSGNSGLDAGDVTTAELQINADTNTAQNLFSDFLKMVDEVATMDKATIDNLDNSEILQLGTPIQRANVNTTFFEDEVMNRILRPLERLADGLPTLSQTEYNFLNNRFEFILNQDSRQNDYLNFRNADELREVLKNWASDSDTSKACGDLFNQNDSIVILGEDENFNIANYSCPPGTKFVVRSGIHTGQSVLSSKPGNTWIGLRGAIMDGEGSIYRAFSDGLNQNSIGWLELRKYHLHGIYSPKDASGVLIRRMKFRDIAPDSTGQEFGAIYFENASGITVTESSFENVASAIRFRYSEGPLIVQNNEALNTGRNFFQCGNCSGRGIRVNNNSMDRTSSYGVTMLEDWINIFRSNGESDDWIQVNNNRARGHSLSGSGSFLILGDHGGSYQEAIGNIGINPGQVGIGVAGGYHMKVQANVMYSVAWDSSNVAYYSTNYSVDDSSNCGNHIFPEPNPHVANRANWMCGDPGDCNPPVLNHAWSDGQCGITNDAIKNSVVVDRSMSPDIWNEW